MSGERPSVRLPSRMVPICVSEPIGLARPRRIAITPAMVVVLTAPRPTSMIAEFSFRLLRFSEGFSQLANYIIGSEICRDSRLGMSGPGSPQEENVQLSSSEATLEPLSVTMVGVKLGDRVLVGRMRDPR